MWNSGFEGIVAGMTEAQVIEVQVKKEADLRRQIRRINVFLLVVLAILIIGPAAVTWWIQRQLPIVNVVSIDNVQVIGETALCPGDVLKFSYDFHAKGAGVLVRDLTTWRKTPPKTVIFSTSRRFILDGPIDQHLIEAWHIPSTFHDYETDRDEPIPPGDYRRYLAISSPSRSTVVAITSVEFSIREDCN
jgi:hypothetical protein